MSQMSESQMSLMRKYISMISRCSLLHREQYKRCIRGGHLLQMGPLLSYLEKHQDRVPA